MVVLFCGEPLVCFTFAYRYNVLVYEATTTLAESGAVHPLPPGVHAFVADVRLFSALQGLNFDLKKVQ